MDKIPPEIKGMIIRLVIDTPPASFQSDRRCSQYAAVSREWQAHVEPSVFRRIDLHPGRESKALEIMTPLRQSYVRKIWFHLSKQHSSETFPAHLASLLGYLSGWNMPSGKVELVLSLEHQYRSLVTLPSDTYHQLPKVHSIEKFSIFRRSKISPKACCEIATRFPHLRSINWVIRDRYDRPGSCERQDFAAALALIPESVRDFSLDYSHMDNSEWPEAPEWCLPDNTDPLSLALRQLSIQLETISLNMHITSEFLSGDALWPHMCEVFLSNMDLSTQDVEMGFMHNPGHLERFRDGRSTSNFHRNTLVCGRAAGRMPSLSDMEIWVYDGKPCCTYTRHDPRSAELIIHDAPASALQQDAEEAWCAAARAHLGEGAELRIQVEFDPYAFYPDDTDDEEEEECLVWTQTV